VDNKVYFTIKADTTTVANVGTTTTYTTTPNVVPVGFVMNVTPQISDTDAVLLNIKPSVTRILGFVNDPNPQLTITSLIPEIQTREMESMIKVNSGQIAVMGGLIQDSNTDNEDTIPWLFQLPSVGTIFSNRNRGNAKTELVIFIRPIVVRDASIDGDFRAFRDLAPDANFTSRPNPGKPLESRSRP
jgi:general secretion pathway protein D